MPFYEYNCDNCETPYEEYASVSNYKVKKKCPNCKKNTLYRIYGGGHIGVEGEPKTLGALADRNAKKYGITEDKLLNMEQEKLDRQWKKDMPKGAPPNLGRLRKQAVSKAEQKKMNKLAKMTPTQQERYIETGNI